MYHLLVLLEHVTLWSQVLYEWNIRAREVDENGATYQSPWSASHQYTTLPACANLTDLSVNAEANGLL